MEDPTSKKARHVEEAGEKAKEKSLPCGKGRFTIKWSFEQQLGDGIDEHGVDIFVHRYVGQLYQYTEKPEGDDDDEEEEKERKAGQITLYKIKTSNMTNNFVNLST